MFYKDLKLIQDDLDTYTYLETSPLFSKKNKKVIGKFKDELDGQIMTELVFLSKVMLLKLERKLKN